MTHIFFRNDVGFHVVVSFCRRDVLVEIVILEILGPFGGEF